MQALAGATRSRAGRRRSELPTLTARGSARTPCSLRARRSFAVGFADAHFELTRKPGWDPGSYGYHADDGHKYAGSERGEAYGPPCSAGDVIGCGIRFDDCSIFFTRNGVFLGRAFTYPPSLQLYATIGLHSPNESLSVNFGGPTGAPFVFDVESHVAREKARMYESLSSFDVPVDDLLSLVRSYCLHFGYAQTYAALPSGSSGGPAAEQQPGQVDASAPACEPEAMRSSAAEGKRIANGEAVPNGAPPNGNADVPNGRVAAPASELDALPANGANGGVANGRGPATGGAGSTSPGWRGGSAGVRVVTQQARERALASLRDRHAVRERVMRGDIDGCMALLRERFPSVLDAQLPPARTAPGPEPTSGAAHLSPGSSRGRAAMEVSEADPTSPVLTPGSSAPPNDEDASAADLRRLLLHRRSTMDSELEEIPSMGGTLRAAGHAAAEPAGGRGAADQDGASATAPLSHEQLMQQKWRALFQLKCQGFVELIRRRQLLEAVTYGQTQLAPLRDTLAGAGTGASADAREHLESVVALLAYAGLEGDEMVPDDAPHDHCGLRTMTVPSTHGSYSRARGTPSARSPDRRPASAEQRPLPSRAHATGTAAHAASIFDSRPGAEVCSPRDASTADRAESVKHLMSYEQRERTADLINAAILGARRAARAAPSCTMSHACAHLTWRHAPRCASPCSGDRRRLHLRHRRIDTAALRHA